MQESQQIIAATAICLEPSIERTAAATTTATTTRTIYKHRTMRLIHFFLFIGCAWAEEEQVCTAQGECFADEEAMGKYYAAGTTEKMYIGAPHDYSFGEDQKVAGDQWRDTLDNVERTREYMVGVFNNQTLDNKVKYECKCRHELCSFWATIGKLAECFVGVFYRRFIRWFDLLSCYGKNVVQISQSIGIFVSIIKCCLPAHRRMRSQPHIYVVAVCSELSDLSPIGFSVPLSLRQGCSNHLGSW